MANARFNPLLIGEPRAAEDGALVAVVAAIL